MEKLEKLAKLIRYFILISTTKAGSGHPSSSLSAVDLMTVLFFSGFFHSNLENPKFPNNDRLIFSKGHASPLFYSLYAAAGKISEETLLTFRKFGSVLEGHPTVAFPYTEAATGSLGQGLSIGLGMALNAKYIDKLSYKTYVLLGDSEMAEGSVWEAIQIASHYKLGNLIGILDVNRLGQVGETLYGHNIKAYQDRISAFGWEVIVTDGHILDEIVKAFKKAQSIQHKPVMIVAKTYKGKGVSIFEDKEGWHGKALSDEELRKALSELGEVDKKLRGEVTLPKNDKELKLQVKKENLKAKVDYKSGDMISTRKAYGNALVRIYPIFPDMVVLDAEVSNSTFSETFQKAYPERFFEMFIAEQNMVGAALGLSKREKIPFVSTFAAFFTRAFDQVRMSQYSDANIKFAGSHGGVSIGEDGPSQMGLEDIAMFRSLLKSVVLYPSDALSCERLVEEAGKYKGIVYIRTTRKDTPLIYSAEEQFPIGGSKILKQSDNDLVTVVGAGVTLHESLKAYESLKDEGILIRVIDLYSIKPLDEVTLRKAASETKALLTVEDHYLQGGIGEAVDSALAKEGAKVFNLAVNKIPKSGKSDELLDYEGISAAAIVKKVKELINAS